MTEVLEKLPSKYAVKGLVIWNNTDNIYGGSRVVNFNLKKGGIATYKSEHKNTIYPIKTKPVL